MKIRSVYNNNIVSSIDEAGNEVIVVGSGVGFQKRQGDIIAPNRISKVYRLTDAKISQFEQLIYNTPYEYIRVVELIKEYAELKLGSELSDNIIITLTDHINFAIQRLKKGKCFRNALLWEIKKYYPTEWSISLDALELIKQELKIELSTDEAGFIALHIMNAELNIDTMGGMQFPEVISDIIHVFQETSGQEINEEEMSYERFIVHIKFFLQRLLKGDLGQEDSFIRNLGVHKNRRAYQCAKKIKANIEERFQCRIPEDEVIYLTIHIQRMMNENRR